MTTIATVKTDGLNLRPNPSKAGRVVDILTKGDQLKLSDKIGPRGSWLHGEVIHTRSGLGIGQSGWVDGANVSLAESKPKVIVPVPPSAPRPSPAPAPVVIQQDKSGTFPLWLAGVIAFITCAFVAWVLANLMPALLS